jgi:chromosome transmission fidelity protein 1
MSSSLNINYDKNISQNEFDKHIFPFPFPVYPQQQQLMEVIYNTINTSSIGCFESPTGTGKSLSLICSALLWQQNEENSIISKLEEEIKLPNNRHNTNNSKKVNNNVEDDWLSVFSNNFQAKKQVDNICNNDNEKKSLENYILMKKRLAKCSVTKPQSSNDINNSSTSFNDNSSITKRNIGIKINKDNEIDEFALPNYESGDDKIDNATDNSDSDNEDDNEDEIIKFPQIIYCSRTHSQISQFVNEIKSTVFKDIRCITLGSRKQMCINESVVNNNKSDSKISEICLEMLKNKSKTVKNEITTTTTQNPIAIEKCNKKKKLENIIIQDIKKKQKLNSNLGPCQYHKRSNERNFVDFSLSKIRDIEELTTLGKLVKGRHIFL